MQLIAAVDRSWGIGRQNELLFRIREDMQRFRGLTEGNVVIMGRKTFCSLPGGQPLPNRDNIVLTRDASFSCPGVATCASLEELNAHLQNPAYEDKEVFIIGGEQIYNLLLPYAHVAHITHVRAKGKADTFFPRLSRHPEWVLEELSPWHEEDGIAYAFAAYYNTATQALPE